MKRCFVIQPFDGGKFDKRFKDTYKPAIEECEVEAYRVDLDINSTIPIDDIDEGIKTSDLCLVDITEDNPNVWFELGLAIGYAKDVILICSSERTSKFPFDIQHRKVIKYSNDSASDYEELKGKIKDRVKSIINKNIEISSISKSVQITEGLEPYEIVLLVAIASNADSTEDGAPSWTIYQEMEKNGYTRIASTLGLKRLLSMKYISSAMETDFNGNNFTTYNITPQGMEWLYNNKQKLILKIEKSLDEELPF